MPGANQSATRQQEDDRETVRWLGHGVRLPFRLDGGPCSPTEPPPFMRLEKLTRNLSCMNRGEDESTRCGNAVILVTKNRETRHQYARGGKSVCPTQVKEKGWSLFWRRAIPRCGRGNPGPTAIPPVARVWLRRLVAKRCQNTSPHSSISEQHDPARRCTPVAMFPGPVP